MLNKDENMSCVFRDILPDISKFVEVLVKWFKLVFNFVNINCLFNSKSSTELCVIGIRLLSELVNEINQMDEVRLHKTKNRKRKIERIIVLF